MGTEKETGNPEDVKEIRKDEQQLMTEEEYINLCVSYAMNGGWVKENKKDLLINEYLKPIYAEAVRVLEEVRPEVEKEKHPFRTVQNRMNFVIAKLNACLDATRRIGSTDPDNILRGINDSIKGSVFTWSKYVAEAMYEKVAEVLEQY